MIFELLLPTTLFYVLLGLLIGSFLNVCIYRIPRGEAVAAGRSHCPDCNHVLSPLDLFPILSYLLLKKRCRYCQAPISPRYATVEAITAVFFTFSGFALTALGLLKGWAIWSLLLIPLLDVAVLSLLFTNLMIRFDRLAKSNEQASASSPTRTIQLFLAIDLLHIWVIWLIIA